MAVLTKLDGAFRLPMEEAPLPKIPVQPIGYDEAEVLLQYVSSLTKFKKH